MIIAGTAIEQDPSVGLHSALILFMLLLLFAFQSMFISIWVSRLEIAEFPDSVRRSAPSSSSSCHQTSVFHLSTHFFAVSLNLLRSSNEQGCSRRVHCIMCAVFSVARPHSQVVSPS